MMPPARRGSGETGGGPTAGAAAGPGASAEDRAPLLVVLSGPSGGGKTTLCQHLLAARPSLTRAVTCTTRPPRAGERDGVDYHFLDAATFERRVRAGEFLEHATVYGCHYGTLKQEVLGRLGEGRELILSLDVQGVATIRRQAEADPELRRALVTVFLAPPSLDVLAERLRHRGLDAEEEIQKRLSLAQQELAQAGQFDYVIISSEVPENVQRLNAILEAEKLREARAPRPAYGRAPTDSRP